MKRYRECMKFERDSEKTMKVTDAVQCRKIAWKSGTESKSLGNE